MFNKVLMKLINLPPALNIKFSPMFNRWKLYTKGVTVGMNAIVIGKISVIGQGKIIIGDNFLMTSGEHINPISANVQGAFFTDSPDARIVIGNNVGMSSTRMWIHDSLTIGNNVKIGGGVLLMDTDCHELNYKVRNGCLPTGEGWGETTLSSPIVIEDDVWIGAQSIVLKGVTIGARSIIGAGSVVAKSIPADCIAAGNPCKVIRMITD